MALTLTNNVYSYTPTVTSIESQKNLTPDVFVLLQIYPNPTNDLLTIETDQFDHYSINITTLNGQQILIGAMEGTSHQIDLSPFQGGVYFITIRSKDFVSTRKIIKL